MIIQEKITISVGSRNAKHFEKLGYKIPKYFDKRNRLSIKIGTQIEVSVFDLLEGSNIKVLCECDICKKKQWLTYQDICKLPKHLCLQCSRKEKDFIDQMKKIKTGLKASNSTKEKMKQNNWMSKHSGKDSPFYDFSLSDEERKSRKYTNRWSKNVRKRDNYTCQKCGSNNYLEAHHVNNFKHFVNERFDIDNGITLCNECHILLHKKYGKFTTKKDIILFLSK